MFVRIQGQSASVDPACCYDAPSVVGWAAETDPWKLPETITADVGRLAPIPGQLGSAAESADFSPFCEKDSPA
jgi:hypothetical protein